MLPYLAVALLGPLVCLAYSLRHGNAAKTGSHVGAVLPICQIVLLAVLYLLFVSMEADAEAFAILELFGVAAGIIGMLSLRKDRRMMKNLELRRGEARDLRQAIESQGCRIEAARIARTEAHIEESNLSGRIERVRRYVEDAAGAPLPFESQDSMVRGAAQNALLRFCPNPVVDALVAGKVRAAASLGIDARISIDIPRDIAIDSYALCSLFSNMLDNAIKAQAGVPAGKKSLTLTAHRKAQILCVRCENPISCPASQPVATDGRGLFDEHGWGLEIIGDIARAHGGRLSIEVEDDVFRLCVVLHENWHQESWLPWAAGQ